MRHSSQESLGPEGSGAHAQQGAGEGDMQGFTASRPARAGRHKVNGEGPSLALGVIGGSIV